MTAVLVLAIDTSTPVITAGVVEVLEPHEMIAALQAAASTPDSTPDSAPASPNRLLAERTETDPFGHAEKLMPLVTAALAAAGRGLVDLSAVVVGVGPGPFTGLRVGMATAAALGDALSVAVHGVPSHDAMALAAAGDGDFLVVTDARRKEVYVSGYGSPAARRFGPAVLAPADLPALLAEHGAAPRWVTGAGAPLAAAVLQLPIAEPAGSLSAALVTAAHRPLVTGAVPGPLTPLYLRRPDAAEPTAPKSVLPAGSAPGTAHL